MTPNQEIDRAQDALRVLDNPAYQQAMRALKADIVATWKSCPVRDQEGQLLLLQLAKLAEKFDGLLTGYVEAGKLAQHKIDINSERNENVVRRWFRKVA